MRRAAAATLCTSPSRSPRRRSCATWPRSGSSSGRWVDAGLLRFRCFRPILLGLEAHLFDMQKLVREFDPAVVVKDPVSDLLRVGTGADVSAMLTRQVDFLKARGVTALFTSLTYGAELRAGRPAARVARRHLVAGEEHGGQRRAQPGPVRPQVPGAWPTPTRSASSSSPIRGSSWPTSTSGPRGCSPDRHRQAQEAQERADATARQQDLEQRSADLQTRREAVDAQVGGPLA